MAKTTSVRAVLLCSAVLLHTSGVAGQLADSTENPLSIELGALIDEWHAAAASADAGAYFGLMDEDAIYIGTEAGERWTKPEFIEFGRPYFDRGSAWSFTPTSRHIRVSDDGQLAWFDELLDTWMGVCAGSGVLQRTAEGWKIKHYHLAVTVPNSLINEFIELVKSGGSTSEER